MRTTTPRRSLRSGPTSPADPPRPAAACQNRAVAGPWQDVDALVDNMFSEVFSGDERALLLERIKRWEARNPGLTSAERVTAWIDVAYAFQEECRVSEVLAPAQWLSTVRLA
jgi:hypothetical protein